MITACARSVLFWVIVSGVTVATEPILPTDSSSIEFEGKRWVAGEATKVAAKEYRNRTALWVGGQRDSILYLPDVEIRNGTIEADFATPPRGMPGISFRGFGATDDCGRVMVRRRRSRGTPVSGVIEQALVARRKGTFCFLQVGIPATAEVSSEDLYEWFHLKVVFHDDEVKVYLNGSEKPSIELGSVFPQVEKGTVGVCGNDFYFANFRYSSAD